MSSSVVPPAPVRTPLPEGTIPVGIALLLAGFATYAFFQVGTVAVGGAEEFAPLAGAVVRHVRPGTRALPAARTGARSGHLPPPGARPGLPNRSCARWFASGRLMLGLALLGIAIASPFLASAYFDGNWFMVLALAMAFVGYAPAHLARGVCSGRAGSRSTRSSWAPTASCASCSASCWPSSAITAVGAYGMVIAISPLFAVAYVFRRGGLKTDPGPDGRLERSHAEPRLAAARLDLRRHPAQRRADRREPARRAENEDALVTAFSYGVLLARIPLFMFQAVQAALLPRLSRLAARGELVEFRAGLRRLIVVVIGVGVVGIAGSVASSVRG